MGVGAGYAHMCTWKSEADVEMSSSISLHLAFGDSISHRTRNPTIRLANWPASRRNPPIPVSSVLVQAGATIPGFLH